MVIFHSYLSLPEGTPTNLSSGSLPTTGQGDLFEQIPRGGSSSLVRGDFYAGKRKTRPNTKVFFSCLYHISGKNY